MLRINSENELNRRTKKHYGSFCEALCLAFVLAVIEFSAGCQMSAPMHVWKAPEVPKPGYVRIGVAPIGGANLETNERLQTALLRTQPNPNPMVTALHPADLANAGGIQLVSYDSQPNDMATLSAARRAGMDYILQGNVVKADLEVPPPDPKAKQRFRIFKPKEKVQYVTVHWSVIDVPSGQRIQEKTITMDSKQALKENPELAFTTQSPDAQVLMASARQSWSLVAPTVEPTQAMIDLPWLMLGSSRVRKGNGFAKQGNWEKAEREWQEAADQHSWNTAAWKNLSFSAAAREDFSLARDRLKHADTFWPGDSTYPTLTWIEQRQRHYHKSLDIAPPVSGWTLPDPPRTVRPDEVPSSAPRDIKDMPWWTAIPFIPPPGWTWKQWLTQPIVL